MKTLKATVVTALGPGPDRERHGMGKRLKEAVEAVEYEISSPMSHVHDDADDNKLAKQMLTHLKKARALYGKMWNTMI